MEKENNEMKQKNISRRDLLKTAVVSGAAMLAGGIASKLTAHETTSNVESKSAKESSRLVRSSKKFPYEIKEGKFPLWLCACGLSKNKPYCDGSHKQTQDEEPGEMYVYRDKERVKL